MGKAPIQTPSPIARAALYLRVSTGRQAESDLSIPDQRRQLEAYCLNKNWSVAPELVEPGNTATDDKRPAFQAMIDLATEKPSTVDVVLVHSFSRSSETSSSLSSTSGSWLAMACASSRSPRNWATIPTGKSISREKLKALLTTS
jgi:hypothetical protein